MNRHKLIHICDHRLGEETEVPSHLSFLVSVSPPTPHAPKETSGQSSLKYFFSIYLFIYLWLRWVFVAARGLSLVVVSGSSYLRCTGFSLRWLL